MDTALKYFLYARKSSEQEDRQVLSIGSQEQELKMVITREKLKVKDFLSESHSAKAPGRPVFDEMIKRIEAGEANGILVWNPSRLSRNSVDAGRIIYLLDENKLLEVRTPSQVFKNTPNDKFLLNLFCSQAKLDNDNKGEDVKIGLKRKAAMGHKPGVAPAGYLNTPDREKGVKIQVPDPERFNLVRKMWDLMLTGHYTPPKILEIVNKNWGYLTVQRRKEGGKSLSRSGIYKIFSNPFYYGEYEYPEGSGVWYKGQYEAMVTKEEYDRVQILLGRKGKPRPQKHNFAYVGKFRCGECGCLCTAEDKHKILKSTNTLKTYVYYHCTRRKKGVQCSQRGTLREDRLEQQIDEELKKYTILPEFRAWALEVLNQRNDLEIEDRNKIYETQQKKLLKLQKELDSLTQMRYRDLIDDELFINQRDVLQEGIKSMRERVKSTEARADDWLELTERTFNFATYARVAFMRGDNAVRREILSALGQNFTVKDRKISIEANLWFQPIEEGYPELEKEYLKLELGKMPIDTKQKEAIASIRTRWLRRQDSNLQPSR